MTSIIRIAQRKTSTGPWTIYKLTDGNQTYIGKTCLSLADRLKNHTGFMKAGTHVNDLLQQAYDNGSTFTIEAISVHDLNDDARIAEDKAIKAIPTELSFNLRQKRVLRYTRQPGTGRSDEYLRTTSTNKVNTLIKQGLPVMAACRQVAEGIEFSYLTVYSWLRGMPQWHGKDLKFILKEVV